MSDLVKRLRQHALPDPHDEREVLHAPLLKEAADKIEELEAKLASIENELGNAQEAERRMAVELVTRSKALAAFDEFNKEE